MSEKRDEAQAAAWVREHANNVVDALDGIYPAIKLAVYAYLSGLAKGREMERQRCAHSFDALGVCELCGLGETDEMRNDAAIRESGK